jgi:hypothetical protein
LSSRGPDRQVTIVYFLVDPVMLTPENEAHRHIKSGVFSQGR